MFKCWELCVTVASAVFKATHSSAIISMGVVWVACWIVFFGIDKVLLETFVTLDFHLLLLLFPECVYIIERKIPL